MTPELARKITDAANTLDLSLVFRKIHQASKKGKSSIELYTTDFKQIIGDKKSSFFLAQQLRDSGWKVQYVNKVENNESFNFLEVSW